MNHLKLFAVAMETRFCLASLSRHWVPTLLLFLLLVTAPARAAVTGQWDFNSGTLSATVGLPLQFRGDTSNSTQFGTTISFGLPNINGRAAVVLRFPAMGPGQGLLLSHGANPNGGGTRVNRYSLVMDVLFPSGNTGYRSFWQTETNNPALTDGELFLNGSQGIGIGGQYHGVVTPDAWHRIVFTVDLTTRELGKYIDGTNVLTGPAGAAPLGLNALQYLDPGTGGVDGRWSLDRYAVLFGDENYETGVGYLNSIQFHDRVLNPAEVGALGGPSSGGIPVTLPATVAQWDFNGDLTSSTGGNALTTGFAVPAGSPDVVFTNQLIHAESAQVAAFSQGTYFRLIHRFLTNGGGVFVNNYTLIMDVMFPSRPTGWAALWQTSPANADDADWFINPSRALGVPNTYGGVVADGTWNRLALVRDSALGTSRSFINGVPVQQLGGMILDGPGALDVTALLFADENGENAAGFVNSVQLRAQALSDPDLAALGGPTAAGIPLPTVPVLRVLSPNGGGTIAAGSTQAVSWTAVNASGFVQVDLYHDTVFFRTLGEAPMQQTNFVWTVDRRIGDAADYRIKISAVGLSGVEDYSDGMFSITGSLAAANPLFGQPLQVNGGFEQALDHWQTLQGRPVILTTGTKGAPHSGTRFLHGGLNPGGDALVRQEIDLLAAGFSAADLDDGANVTAQAWLRNLYGINNFDDQVFHRVTCVDAFDNELYAVRSMVAANSIWLQLPIVGRLPVGTRKLRVEIVGKHRRDLDNDSMADDIVVSLTEATQAVTPLITKLPMLQDVRTNAMTLLWETSGNATAHSVEWGRSNITENTLTHLETLQIDSSHFVHRATLTGLEAETSYQYRVRSGAATSGTYSFRTAPRRDTPFAVAWWGDNHAGTTTLRTHVGHLMSHGPDLICVAGDMVNSGNLLDEWHDYWFQPLEHLNAAQTRPVMFARGNHDGEHALAYAYSALPGNEAWFAFDYGNTRFIFLDSETTTSSSPEQLAWLRAELARPETRRAAFRVVCFHRPPWVNLWNGGGTTGEVWVRNDWTPLFAQNNVDLVISGHAHNYNRGTTNGVTYVISGGGGGTLDVERVANWPFYTVEYSRYHWDLMEVNGNTLSWEVYDDSNALIDTMTLQSRVPSVDWTTGAPVGNAVPLIVSGRRGSTYILDSSTDLKTWAPFVTNVISATGAAVRTNLIPLDAPQRFFRARSNP